PGIPWGRLEGGLADGTTVVTKSGGFGGPDLLLRVVDSLKEKEQA
ncbi:MAG: four-carbon acid sugar kinase family protein, partial [Acidobacteriia bacterium]|nr:four-carbon acid sugar kinase family protein [Terriglobia bacterium]